MLKQQSVLEVKIKISIDGENKERLYQLQCDSASPLGELHDALMQMKGWCVDRMIAAQKEEQAQSDAQKKDVIE